MLLSSRLTYMLDSCFSKKYYEKLFFKNSKVVCLGNGLY